MATKFKGNQRKKKKKEANQREVIVVAHSLRVTQRLQFLKELILADPAQDDLLDVLLPQGGPAVVVKLQDDAKDKRR